MEEEDGAAWRRVKLVKPAERTMAEGGAAAAEAMSKAAVKSKRARGFIFVGIKKGNRWSRVAGRNLEAA